MLKNIATEIAQILGGDFEIYFETSLKDIGPTEKCVGVFYNAYGDIMPLANNTGIEANCELDVYIPTKFKENETRFNALVAKLDSLVGQLNGTVKVDGQTTPYKYVLQFGVPQSMGNEEIVYGNFALGYSIPVAVVMTNTLTFGNQCSITVNNATLNGIVNVTYEGNYDLMSVVTANEFTAGHTPQYSDFRLNVDLTLFESDTLHRTLMQNHLAQTNNEYSIVYKPVDNIYTKSFVGVVEKFVLKETKGKFNVYTLTLAKKKVYQSTPLTLTLSSTHANLTVTRDGVPLSSGDTINNGDVLSVTATASSGYVLTVLTVNGTTISSGDTVVVRSDTTIVATGTQRQQYTLAINQGANSTITVKRNGTTISVGTPIYQGDQLIVTATASNGYTLSTFTINGTTVLSPSVVNVTQNVAIITVATRIMWTVNIGSFWSGGSGLTYSKIVDGVETQLSGETTVSVPTGSKIKVYCVTSAIGTSYRNFIIAKDYNPVKTVDSSGENVAYEILINNNAQIDTYSEFAWIPNSNQGTPTYDNIIGNTRDGITIPAGYTPIRSGKVFVDWQVTYIGNIPAGTTVTPAEHQTAIQGFKNQQILAHYNNATRVNNNITVTMAGDTLTATADEAVSSSVSIVVDIRNADDSQVDTQTLTIPSGQTSVSATAELSNSYIHGVLSVSPQQDVDFNYIGGYAKARNTIRYGIGTSRNILRMGGDYPVYSTIDCFAIVNNDGSPMNVSKTIAIGEQEKTQIIGPSWAIISVQTDINGSSIPSGGYIEDKKYKYYEQY